jgi:hypothetical protein
MNSMQSIPALQYEFEVRDIVRGDREIIKEIFIPSHQVIITSKGGLFKAEKPRNVQSLHPRGGPQVERPLTNIQLPKELVEKIVLIANLKFEVNNKEKELAPDLEKVWG